MQIKIYYPSEQSRMAKVLMEENSEWTLTEIGKAMGVGRERARQLLLAEGISIRKYRGIKYEKERICPSCGGIKAVESNICSKCYKEQHNVTFVCEVCEEEFTRYKSQAERDGGNTPRFCSRTCQGVWLGTQYGFKGEKLGQMDQGQRHESDDEHKRTVEAGKVD